MRNRNYKHYLLVIGIYLLATIFGLWSWNTLSELYNLPHAQYKHALAVFFLLLMLKWGLSPGGRLLGRDCGRNHEPKNH